MFRVLVLESYFENLSVLITFRIPSIIFVESVHRVTWRGEREFYVSNVYKFLCVFFYKIMHKYAGVLNFELYFCGGKKMFNGIKIMLKHA
jgi:hypothetical protein